MKNFIVLPSKQQGPLPHDFYSYSKYFISDVSEKLRIMLIEKVGNSVEVDDLLNEISIYPTSDGKDGQFSVYPTYKGRFGSYTKVFFEESCRINYSIIVVLFFKGETLLIPFATPESPDGINDYPDPETYLQDELQCPFYSCCLDQKIKGHLLFENEKELKKVRVTYLMNDKERFRFFLTSASIKGFVSDNDMNKRKKFEIPYYSNFSFINNWVYDRVLKYPKKHKVLYTPYEENHRLTTSQRLKISKYDYESSFPKYRILF